MEKKIALEERLKKFREQLNQKGLDGALVTKRENYIYLSGFTGTSANLVITQEHAILLTDFRYVEQAEVQAPLFKIEKYQGNIVTALNEVLNSSGINSLGFEESYITYEKYNEFKEKLGVKEFVPLQGIIEKLRMFKDDYELDIIKKAVKIADDAFTHILPYIKPGVTEIEIAAEMEYYMKKAGAIGASFETIVASGQRSSMPHGVASDKKLELGDPITLDYGAYYEHYCSDMTRTVFLGQPKDEMKKIYNIVLEAQLKSSEGAAAGLLGKDIDLIARDIIYKNGY
ncbi:MAG: peptidase, partial [Clostridiales bacterium]|nr:peptidase [Clostridiales bacterium]